MRVATGFLWLAAAALLAAGFSPAASAAGETAPRAATVPRDGQHDFDFDIGTWKTHTSRLQRPLSGSTSWIEMDGTTVVRKVWGGRANLAEFESDGPTGHLELLSLRLYDPQAHQWNLNFATSNVGILSVPMVGDFRNGRGEFFDQEPFNGRTILVRFSMFSTGPDSARSEQAFSDDGGKTWETNWINIYTRAKDGSDAPLAADRQQDFDFEIGTWKTQLSRRVHPLTGSTTWVELQGTSVVRRIWNGRANLVELEVDGPAGHVEGLSLRLYNPQSREWSLSFANSAGGTLSQPTIGEFKNGRGEFFDQEQFNGITILVRNVWSDITADSCRFEQAFSDDGGKSWETNWIANDTRIRDALAR